jgi:hypothetical protein
LSVHLPKAQVLFPKPLHKHQGQEVNVKMRLIQISVIVSRFSLQKIQFRITCCHVPLVSFHVKKFFNFLLSVITLTLLGIKNKWISLKLNLPDVCQWLDSGYAIFLKIQSHRRYVTFLLHAFRLSHYWWCPFNDLTEQVSAKVTILPFVINNFVERYFETI